MSVYTVLVVENLPSNFFLTFTLNGTNSRKPVTISSAICNGGRGTVNGIQVKTSDVSRVVREIVLMGKDEVQRNMVMETITQGSDEVVAEMLTKIDGIEDSRRRKIEDTVADLATTEMGVFSAIHARLGLLEQGIEKGLKKMDEVSEIVSRECKEHDARINRVVTVVNTESTNLRQVIQSTALAQHEDSRRLHEALIYYNQAEQIRHEQALEMMQAGFARLAGQSTLPALQAPPNAVEPPFPPAREPGSVALGLYPAEYTDLPSDAVVDRINSGEGRTTANQTGDEVVKVSENAEHVVMDRGQRYHTYTPRPTFDLPLGLTAGRLNLDGKYEVELSDSLKSRIALEVRIATTSNDGQEVHAYQYARPSNLPTHVFFTNMNHCGSTIYGWIFGVGKARWTCTIDLLLRYDLKGRWMLLGRGIGSVMGLLCDVECRGVLNVLLAHVIGFDLQSSTEEWVTASKMFTSPDSWSNHKSTSLAK